MKVAVVVNCLKMGGMERVAVNLADAFSQEGHEAHLIYLKNRKIAITPSEKNVQLHLFNLKKIVLQTGIGLIWFCICKVLNIFIKKSFPMFFAYAESMVFSRKLKKLESQGKKFDLIIFRGHGTFSHIWTLKDDRFVFVCENIQNNFLHGRLSGYFYKKLFENRQISCVSEGALKSLDQLLGHYSINAKKSIMITNPIDLAKIKNDANLEDKDLHQKPFILGLGRLVPQKNFSLLISAFYLLISKYGFQHDLVIVGEGKEIENLKRQTSQLELTERVFFKGMKKNPFPWYKHADLFVLSSKHEGLGMVLIESLACHTLPVSTDSKGGVRQIMNGPLELFLTEETPENLALKINEALKTQWADPLSSFIKATLNKFSGPTIVNQYCVHFCLK